MTINFERAALRHFNDASALHQDKRFANADHLAGLAAECALKVALPKRANGDVEGFREHVDKLWERIRVQQIPRHLARLSTLLQTKHRPFADWSIEQRYHDGDAVTEQVSSRHLKAAQRVCRAVGLVGLRSHQ